MPIAVNFTGVSFEYVTFCYHHHGTVSVSLVDFKGAGNLVICYNDFADSLKDLYLERDPGMYLLSVH